MIRARQFLALLTVSACWLFAHAVALGGSVIDCGAEKVVLFVGTNSPEGNYAVGWTLRPKHAGTAPVDWSAWDDETPEALLDRYEWGSEQADAPYELVDCVVDLTRKKFLVLPSDWPDWPHKNRGYIDVLWGSAVQGHRHALIQNDSRFYTHNLWLVTFEHAEMRQLDLVPGLTKTVTQLLRKREVSSFDQYGVFFPLRKVEWASAKGAVFKTFSAAIPFVADIPKSVDDTAVEGMITISLLQGKVTDLSTRRTRGR